MVSEGASILPYIDMYYYYYYYYYITNAKSWARIRTRTIDYLYSSYYTVIKAGSKLNHSNIQRHTVWESGNVLTQMAVYN